MSLLSFSRFQSSLFMYSFITFLSVILLSLLGVCCSSLVFLFDYQLRVSDFQVVLILLMCVYIYFFQSFLIKWVWYLLSNQFLFHIYFNWLVRTRCKTVVVTGHSSKSGIGCWFDFIVINFCFQVHHFHYWISYCLILYIVYSSCFLVSDSHISLYICTTEAKLSIACLVWSWLSNRFFCFHVIYDFLQFCCYHLIPILENFTYSFQTQNSFWLSKLIIL